MLLGRRAWSWRSRDEPVPYDFLPFQRKDRTIKPWDQTTNQLKNLDALVAALKEGLGPAWGATTVLVATEFGRTAAMNGTGGTDHGTGSVAMLVGGAVKGGRVIANWPGLAAARLYDQRDLRPTSALDAVIAGAVSESLLLDPQRVGRSLFAQATSEAPLTGLLRT